MTAKQLKAAPVKLFAGVGVIEALSQVLGFIGASKLPGAHRRRRRRPLLPLLCCWTRAFQGQCTCARGQQVANRPQAWSLAHSGMFGDACLSTVTPLSNLAASS